MTRGIEVGLLSMGLICLALAVSFIREGREWNEENQEFELGVPLAIGASLLAVSGISFLLLTLAMTLADWIISG